MLTAIKERTIWVAKACAKLSSWLPDKIIVCSHAALKSHLALGYYKEKMFVIPNGFDLDEFRPDREARKSVRKELKLDENALLVGLVARFDPQKDHRNFIEAAQLSKKKEYSLSSLCSAVMGSIMKMHSLCNGLKKGNWKGVSTC